MEDIYWRPYRGLSKEQFRLLRQVTNPQLAEDIYFAAVHQHRLFLGKPQATARRSDE